MSRKVYDIAISRPDRDGAKDVVSIRADCREDAEFFAISMYPGSSLVKRKRSSKRSTLAN